MNWIERVRSKPKAERIRLIWEITGVAAILLIIAWILVGRHDSSVQKNTELFKAIGNGVKNIKLENPQTNNTGN